MPGGVLGDGQGLEGVPGQRGEHGVACGAGVGAGAAQGDEEFMDGSRGFDLQEGVSPAGGPGDPADRGAWSRRVRERDHGQVRVDVAEFGVRVGRGAVEVDEALVPAAGVGSVVVGDAGGDPDQGGCGDGEALPVGRAEPAAPRADHHGHMVVQRARPHGRKAAVL